MVCANNKYVYPNIHVLSMSPLHCSYKTNMFPATIFQTYDLISCDTSCNHSYVSLYCPRKFKKMKNKIKNQIKKNIKSKK